MRARSLLLLSLLIVVAGSLLASLLLRQHGNAPATVERPVLDIALVRVATGLERPLFLTAADDGSGRLFVVEQAGRVRILRDGELLERPFLDIVPLVGLGGNEQGLLSIAFHPNFAENGQFFVDYTDVNGDSVVARYHVSADDADLASPESADTLLMVEQPAANHNGGQLRFGPDGFLYIGFGDGGGGHNGQATDTLLGKILRIDVDRSGSNSRFAVPPDNPFVANPAVRPEIWLTGLRNPWRFSFDAVTGDLYIGDVGAGTWEEIDVVPAGLSGLNLGWNVFEGPRCNLSDELCDDLGMAATLDITWPVTGYRHGDGDCAITGGHVYRGDDIPALRGVYLFADYCSGRVWGAVRDASGRWLTSDPLDTELRVSSFGVDDDGGLYLVDLRGAVYRVGSER